jgi:hypothetical protein
MIAATQPLLEVKNLKKYFPIRKGFFRKTVGNVRAVDDVSFFINPGETLGLVGESGCGKTTASRADVSHWRAGEWHHVVVVWTALDGKPLGLPLWIDRVAVAGALEDTHLVEVVGPALRHRQVHAAVRADAEPRVRHAVARDDGHARVAAGLGVELPLAAVADHHGRVERADGAAERAVGRRAEVLLDEFAGPGVPCA